MSKRSVIIDDKLLSEMVLRNITTASKNNFDLSTVFNDQQMQLMTAYKKIYNYPPNLTFFLSLGMMSHFSQNSYFTHYSSPDHRPVQLYLWLLGASGSGKTHGFRQMEKSMMKTEKMFPNEYLKPVIVNGKPTETDLSSIITHTNHIGLRQHLASNNKILLNDDADLIAESYGLYNVNDTTKEHERNLILCGYDGYNNASRTTGSTMICIGDKRLSIVIATTGGKLMKNMKNWYNATGYDGSHNRFLYMAIPKLAYSRPQDFQPSGNAKGIPSFAHLCVVVHLFGTVRYAFQMSEAERAKFFDAKFESQMRSSQKEQTQTQQEQSAMFTVWNLIADLVETSDQKENEQQQITDFYAKAASTFPRLACLVQLYFNASQILEQIEDTVFFAEGDNNEMIINENFVRRAKDIIQSQYYVHDRTYLPSAEAEQIIQDPLIIVRKDAVITAWKWYEKHLTIASTLFTIDTEFTGSSIITSSLTVNRRQTLKQSIMSVDFNIFPLATITDKHPVTGQTGIIKNRPAMGERAIQELMAADLLKYNYFLLDTRGRKIKAYMKTPIPPKDNPAREDVLKKLQENGINIVDYCSIYKSSSIPPSNALSSVALESFKSIAALVPEYLKYEQQLQDVIRQHLDDDNIRLSTTGNFVVKNQDVFFREFSSITNIRPGEKLEQEKPLSYEPLKETSANQSVRSVIHSNTATMTGAIVIPHETIEESLEDDHENFEQRPADQDCVRNSLLLDDETSQNMSISTENASNETSIVEQQQHHHSIESGCARIEPEQSSTKARVTNTNATELAVKKAMLNIMTSSSVIYTKTDLSQICNKAPIRIEAISRLLDAKLLTYSKDYWVEPNRTKKESKKEPKRILREGWLKGVPSLNTSAAKFQYLQSLQEHIGLSYEDFMKSFHQNNLENVFTNNNWTLSNEVVDIFKSNFFYREHVRWNIERYRPTDLVHETKNTDNRQRPSTQTTYLPYAQESTTNDAQPNLAEVQTNDVDENNNIFETNAKSMVIRPKRKACWSEDNLGHQTRTQTGIRKQIKYTDR